MLFNILYFFLQMLLQNAGYGAALPVPQDRNDSVIKTDVVLVTIDVAVRNKEGAFVDNLRANDFVVYDNGVSQQIDLFSQEEMPLDVALIVKCSYSEKPYMAELKHAAMNVFHQLSPKIDRVALFCFGNWPFQLTSLTQDGFLFTQALDKIQNLDGSNIKDSLWEAAHYLRSKGPHRRRAIILISDNHGSPFGLLHSNKETLDEMLEAGAIFYSIQTSGNNHDWREDHPWFIKNPYDQNSKVFVAEKSHYEESPKEIALLARETGGEVLNTQSESDLFNTLKAAILSLKHSYTLGFYPSNKGADGSYHELKVQMISHADYSLQARTGYYFLGSALTKIHQEGHGADSHSTNSNLNGRHMMPKPSSVQIIRSLSLGSLIPKIVNLEKKGPIKGQISQSDYLGSTIARRIDFTAVAKGIQTLRENLMRRLIFKSMRHN
jgi:Ca-activated chloride channel homolog